MRRILAMLLTGAAAASAGGQSARPDAAAIAALGPQVGQPAPDFTLPDQQGRPRSLRSILGPKGAMLVFFRSADW